MFAHRNLLPVALCLGLIFGMLAGISHPAPVAAAEPVRVDITTHHNNNSRTGANLLETTLNTSNVNPTTFGKLFTIPVDGHVYAQPLYLSDKNIKGKKRNVLYVATMHNTVYCFDADTSEELWKINVGPSVPLPDPNIGWGLEYKDIFVEIGILSTPVIDRNTNTIYFVAMTKLPDTDKSDGYEYHLHAHDLTTGEAKSGSPKLIEGRYPLTAVDNTTNAWRFTNNAQSLRSALTLANGRVYFTAGSFADNGFYSGWVFGYNAQSLAQEVIYNTTPYCENPCLSEGGVWMSAQGITVDSEGNLYVTSGNGATDVRPGGRNHASSVLKLSSKASLDTPELMDASWNLWDKNDPDYMTKFNALVQDYDNLVVDWFTPHNYEYLNANDLDISAGLLLVPGTDILVTGGKEGWMYVLDRNNLGHFQPNSEDAQIVQRIKAAVGNIHGGPVYWEGPNGKRVYVWGESDYLQEYEFAMDPQLHKYQLSLRTQSSFPAPLNTMPGGFLSVSADGGRAGTGIVWANMQLQKDANHAVVQGVLRAFDATDLTKELWNSNSDRDNFGNFAKFAPPTVANGKVYLATFSGGVAVYGLLDQADLVAPKWPADFAIQASGVSSSQVTLSWNKATDNVGVTGYELYQKKAGDETFTHVQTTGQVETATVTGLQPETEYTFKLKALDAAGNKSSDSSTFTIRTLPDPNADTQAPQWPDQFVIYSSGATTSQFTVSWTEATDNVGVTGYELYMKNGDQFSLIQTLGPINNALVTNLQPDTAYTFRLKAFDAAEVRSADSTEYNFRTLTETATDTEPPQWPDQFVIYANTKTTKQLDLSWPPATDNIGVAGYELYMKQGDQFSLIQSVGAIGNTLVTGLQPDTDYSFRLIALDASGKRSSESAVSTIRTAADTTAPGTQKPPPLNPGSGNPPPLPSNPGSQNPPPPPPSTNTPPPPQQTVALVEPLDASDIPEELRLNVRQAVKVTQETKDDGAASTKIALDTKLLMKALAGKPSAQYVIIELPESDSKLQILIPVSLLQDLKEDRTVEVVITRVTGKILDLIKDAAKKELAELRTDPLSVQLYLDGKATVVYNGDRLAIRMQVFGAITPFQTSALSVDEQGKLSFVPSYFTGGDGKSEVTIYTPDNRPLAIIKSYKLFKDMRGHPSEMDAMMLANKFIVSGTGDSIFSPNKSVTRAEFAAMLVRSLGLPLTRSDIKFKDVRDTDWFALAVTTAAQTGFVSGYPDATFRPNETVTREQILVMISKALDYADRNQEADVNLLKAFKDGSAISAWARNAAAQAMQADILRSSTTGVMDPKFMATREEAAILLKRMLQYLKFLN